ncbi:amino acid permease [Neobacillus pocheonensis]|uniref:amino acid permease n=1 Tax=Neobacillus pocheonensis TaxID=363869 RepID=UPI003D2D3E1E
MENDLTFKQVVNHKKAENVDNGVHSGLAWWQLSLIGIGSVIGAGFFLGTGLSIKTAGPAILINYAIAGLTAYFVFSAIAEMTIADPQPGSFRTYAKKAFGHSMGFVSGWVYWLAGIFIMSSEAVALGTFTQFWFPHVPLWIFTVSYAVIAFGINLLGVKNFGKIESLFGILKLSTLIIFIFFGLLILFHMIAPQPHPLDVRNVWTPLIPNGIAGMWAALIFTFFSFGGIEVMGVASSELKNKSEIQKAGSIMLMALVAVYILSIFFILYFVSWTKINESQSPFVTALTVFHIPYIDSLFNVIIISAAFSTMVGALFSVTNILISLAEDRDAPKLLASKNRRGVPIKSLFVTGLALSISLLLSFILPGKLYEYVTTAAGVLLILNWIIILSTQIKLRKSRKQTNTFKMPGYPTTSYLGIAIILLTVSGGMRDGTQRMGVLISLGLILIIFLLSIGKNKFSSIRKNAQ